MKKLEVEDMLNTIVDIREIISKENYNLFTKLNEKLNRINIILTKEYDRMNNDNIEIICPKLLTISPSEIIKSKMTDVDYINDKLKELVLKEYKIIDYGIYNVIEGMNFYYIKYTT